MERERERETKERHSHSIRIQSHLHALHIIDKVDEKKKTMAKRNDIQYSLQLLFVDNLFLRRHSDSGERIIALA